VLDRRVPPSLDGSRVDVVLAGWLDETRARAQRRLAAGEVKVDGVVVPKSYRVSSGDRIVVAAPPPPPAPEPPPHVPVRFQDEHLAVVAKPAGLVVHPGAGARGPTLVDALRSQAPIGRSPVARTRFRVDADGRPAITHYDVLEAFGRAAAIDVRLETGRTHQVRVHLSAIGHPVTGDATYGASPALAAELGLRRPALHARFLGFDHPLTGERVDVEEPLPSDLVSALHRLRDRNPRGL
jgi:23S rRNA-/tRNA-specific pseudouridylate synthase